MSIQREDAQKFSDLDAEIRIKLLLEYIRVLREGYVANSTKLTENSNVNIALDAAYKLLQKEFEQ